MDAPKGRYSVVEKDGRLVVIDNGTGAPIPSTFAPPAGRPGRSGTTPPVPVSGAGPGVVDRAADALLALAAREWDSQGRAVIAWKWEQNGVDKRWDAALDRRQQRRMGRALLALAAAPLMPLLLLLAGGKTFALAALVIFPTAAWGAVSLQRLYRETNDPSRV
ncbi:MAG TPA: hypothetical protein VF718_09820 [Allosphingosinicella sp.]|jgi:hypothetical protein